MDKSNGFFFSRGSETIGIRHTCRVANNSKETVKVVVTDYAGRNSAVVMGSQQSLKFNMDRWAAGEHGKVTVSLFRKENGRWREKADVCYTGNTNWIYRINHGPEDSLIITGEWSGKN